MVPFLLFQLSNGRTCVGVKWPRRTKKHTCGGSGTSLFHDVGRPPCPREAAFAGGPHVRVFAQGERHFSWGTFEASELPDAVTLHERRKAERGGKGGGLDDGGEPRKIILRSFGLP